jgi:hypothetical protein
MKQLHRLTVNSSWSSCAGTLHIMLSHTAASAAAAAPAGVLFGCFGWDASLALYYQVCCGLAYGVWLNCVQLSNRMQLWLFSCASAPLCTLNWRVIGHHYHQKTRGMSD